MNETPNHLYNKQCMSYASIRIKKRFIDFTFILL